MLETVIMTPLSLAGLFVLGVVSGMGLMAVIDSKLTQPPDKQDK